MAWCRAVWQEDELEEEGVIPSCWVDSQFVYWPSKKNVLSAAKEHAKPDATWQKFKVLKVKCYDDDKELCESYEFSSNEEVPTLDKSEPLKKETKKMKYTLKKAASSTLAYPTPLQFEASQKKIEAPPPKRFKKLKVTDTGKSTLTSPLKDESTYPTPKCNGKIKKELYESFKLYSNDEIEFKIEQRNKNDQIRNAYAKKTSNTLTTSPFHPTPPKFENPLIQIDVLFPRKKTLLEEPVNQKSSLSFLKDKFPKSTQQEKKKASVFPLEEGSFQYKIIHLLTELKNDVADIKTMLKNENSFELHQCKSIQEFHDFDQSLLDQDVAKNVKQKLSNIGGLTCSAIAKGMLSKVMSNKVMSLFNMAGTNKLSFRKTNLMKILCDCLPDLYSEKDLQNVVGSILKHAPDRKEGGGRQKSIFGYELEEEGDFLNL